MKKNKKPLSEKDLLDIVGGRRKPRTPREKELKKQADTLKKKGRIIDIPKDFV